MDEQLIGEVQQHGVIYNRQKYFMSHMGGSVKYESKDEAWQIIAMKLGSDIDSCKKRWKYLRERYVSQRKQSDPPVYEHLSRPYLEKMKFLDQHITPRKSYRNVPSYLTSPNGGSNYIEYNLDSSRSNGSSKNYPPYPNYHDNHNNAVKTEPDQVFRDFAAAVATQQFQQINNSQTGTPTTTVHNGNANPHSNSNYYDRLRENETSHIPSSSSSLKSPPSSSSTNPENNDLNIDSNKKPRVQCIDPNQNIPSNDDSSDDNDGYLDEPPPPPVVANANHRFMSSNGRHEVPPMYPNNDHLMSLYQQLPQQNRQARSSEHLVGELVTSELLKMSKERRKTVQKRILEILFFDD